MITCQVGRVPGAFCHVGCVMQDVMGANGLQAQLPPDELQFAGLEYLGAHSFLRVQQAMSQAPVLQGRAL